jgi:hypothetical protein
MAIRKSTTNHWRNEAMTEQKSTAKAGRPSRSLDEEIAATEARLKALRDKKREDEKREREKNHKAILAIIKEEGLDGVSVAKWQKALPGIKKLLAAEVAPTKDTPASSEAVKSPAVQATTAAAAS